MTQTTLLKALPAALLAAAATATVGCHDLLVVDLAAGIGCRRQACQGTHLFPILELPPAEEFVNV